MSQQRHSIPLRTIFSLTFFVVIITLLPLLITRRWGWVEAWAYAAIWTLGFGLSRLLAVRQHPDLLAERARMMQHADVLPWDRVLAPAAGVGGGFIPLVAGLDALYGWSPAFGVAVKVAGLGALIAGIVVASYALIENRYFSGVVRIQTERDHHVVSSGPYRWVRHPGYAGALLGYLGTPLLLDSAWAFVPAVALCIAVVIRTALEDRTLQERLPGYREYAGRVRYRLVPGVW